MGKEEQKAMKLRFDKDDVACVLERLGKCEFLKEFKKIGKARYMKDAADGIRHGVEFHISRSHQIALFVTPYLLIDHKQARKIIREGADKTCRELTHISLCDIVNDCNRHEYGLILPIVKEILEDPGHRKTLMDHSRKSPYQMITVALGGHIDVETRKLNDTDPTLDRFLRGYTVDLDDFILGIEDDLNMYGTEFFRNVETIEGLIHWIKTDPLAGFAYKSIIIISLYYVQGRTEEILNTIDSWAGSDITPTKAKFAKYITDKIQPEGKFLGQFI